MTLLSRHVNFLTKYCSAQTKDISSLIVKDAPRKLAILKNKLNRLKVINYIFTGDIPSNNIADRFGNPEIYDNLEQKIIRLYQTPPRLYYIAIGKDDFMMSKPLKKKFSTLTDILDAHKLSYEYHITEGAHSWENWRRYLVNFLPKLFR